MSQCELRCSTPRQANNAHDVCAPKLRVWRTLNFPLASPKRAMVAISNLHATAGDTPACFVKAAQACPRWRINALAARWGAEHARTVAHESQLPDGWFTRCALLAVHDAAVVWHAWCARETAQTKSQQNRFSCSQALGHAEQHLMRPDARTNGRGTLAQIHRRRTRRRGKLTPAPTDQCWCNEATEARWPGHRARRRGGGRKGLTCQAHQLSRAARRSCG